MIFQIPFIGECSAQHLATQGQFIGESEEGWAFAEQYFGEEFGNCGANAQPLQGYASPQKNL